MTEPRTDGFLKFHGMLYTIEVRCFAMVFLCLRNITCHTSSQIYFTQTISVLMLIIRKNLLCVKWVVLYVDFNVFHERIKIFMWKIFNFEGRHLKKLWQITELKTDTYQNIIQSSCAEVYKSAVNWYKICC